jgi:hypothetical protein
MSLDQVPPRVLTTAHEIERAKRLGTYGKVDRSKQYEGRYSPEALLKSDNHLWLRIRTMQEKREQEKRKTAFFRFLYGLGVVMASNAPAIVKWAERLFAR